MITDLGILIKGCKDELHDREYRLQYAAQLAEEWENLCRWMQEEELIEFNRSVGYRYCDETIGSHLIVDGMSTTRRIKLRAVRMLISYQEDGGFEFRSPRVERSFDGETGKLVQSYLEYERERGRSGKTIANKELYLYRFNQYLTEHELVFNDLTVDIIEDFFQTLGDSLATRHNCADHLRQLFHYLYDNEITGTDKALLVLKDNYKNECKLPTTYSEEEISRIIAAVDRASSTGKRDYLILLLAAEYGWRSGDIVNFKFSQIDWDKNTIAYAQSKTGNTVEFPLLSSVGNAIIDYLKYGRPETTAQEIIVSNRGDPLQPPTIHSIVARYMREANIENWQEKKHGPHSLRHSLATNMLKNNVSMPVISTVLGHQRTETTKVYMKIDVKELSRCALPMPGLSASSLYKEVNAK